MKKLKLMALAGVMVSSLLIEHANAAAGVDRIDPDYAAYTYFLNAGDVGLLSNWGVWSKGVHDCGRLSSFVGTANDIPEARYEHRTGGRTFNKDLIGALIDKERFDHALATDRYFDAWSMGSETEQGRLWREMASAGARKRVDELALRSALAKVHSEAESRPFETEANRIITSFPAGGIRDELRRMYDDGVRLASPPVVTGASPAVRFDHALATEWYFDAWSMGGESEQGRMWKEMAAAGAKKKCKELGMESVLLEASDLGESRALSEKAGRIFTSFPEGNPLREELRAQFELGKRLATPPAVPVAAALEAHRSAVARLLEDY